MDWEDLQAFIIELISNKSIEIMEITKMMYFNAVNKMTIKNRKEVREYLL